MAFSKEAQQLFWLHLRNHFLLTLKAFLNFLRLIFPGFFLFFFANINSVEPCNSVQIGKLEVVGYRWVLYYFSSHFLIKMIAGLLKNLIFATLPDAVKSFGSLSGNCRPFLTKVQKSYDRFKMIKPTRLVQSSRQDPILYYGEPQASLVPKCGLRLLYFRDKRSTMTWQRTLEQRQYKNETI